MGRRFGAPRRHVRAGQVLEHDRRARYRHDGLAHALVRNATSERLIVSTSQRAVVALLGGFELDRGAVSWLLSSGSLGPDCSWDSRVRRLPGDSRLILDRRTWRTTFEQRPAVFEPVARRPRRHLGLLRDAVAWSCGALDIDTERWLLPLSGGLDSRADPGFMASGGTARPGASRGRRARRCATRCRTRSSRASSRGASAPSTTTRSWTDRAEGRRRGAPALRRARRGRDRRVRRLRRRLRHVERLLSPRARAASFAATNPLAADARAASLDGARRTASGTMVADYPEGSPRPPPRPGRPGLAASGSAALRRGLSKRTVTA